MTVDHFQRAVTHHRDGRLGEALEACREALAAQPDHLGALALGGATALQFGDYDQGIVFLRTAVALAPDNFDILYNLGFAYGAVKRLDEAKAAYLRAADVRPGFAQPYVNLGFLQHRAGHLDAAAASFRKAIEMEPLHVEALSNLGSVLEAQGLLGEAVAICEQARNLRPEAARLQYNFGRVALRSGRIADAVEAFRRAVQGQPDFTAAHNNLGNALRMAGDLDDAVEAFGRAIELEPDHAETHNNLGALLREMGQPEAALTHLRRAVEIRPGYAQAHNNLGGVFHDFGEWDEATASFRRALDADPDFVEAYGNLLFVANYHPDLPADEIFAEYRRWDHRYARPLAAAAAVHANPRDAGRRLKVGYVSPDFRAHACLMFFEPLLAGHDANAVETFAYAEVTRPDHETERLKGRFDHWRDTFAMSDEALAEAIRADGIDVLVDIAGHTSGNRLLAFARKPAPVQVSWLGYAYTTGLSAMDYFLADADFVPAGAEGLFSEEVWRLPRSVFVFRPPAGMPRVGPPPAAANGSITFGYFSRPVRVNHRVVATWADILHEVPASRLLLNNKPFTDPAMRETVLSRFAVHGIGGDRLTMISESPPWAAYNAIDIALDPFPHNAGSTTFEALWMGVPVVTLAARPSVGRLGATILNKLDLGGWVAHSERGYVERAASAARDLEGLAALRAGLRERMRTSPLMDEAGFAGDVEGAFREMWRRWCAAAPASGNEEGA